MATQIDLAKGIDSLTSFKRNTSAFLDRLRASGQPLVLTINGKAEVVVQNAGAYQRLLKRLEAIEALKRRPGGKEKTVAPDDEAGRGKANEQGVPSVADEAT